MPRVRSQNAARGLDGGARVVVALDAAPPHDGHALSPDERAVDAALVEELRMPRLDRLELDGHLLACARTRASRRRRRPG